MINVRPEAVVSPVVEGAEPGQLAPRHGTPAHYLAANTRGHSSHTPAATCRDISILFTLSAYIIDFMILLFFF